MKAKKLFDIGKSAFSAADVKGFMQPHLKGINKYVRKNIGREDFKGFGANIRGGIQKINRDAGMAGTFYGGLAGGAAGIVSDDRDTGFWHGAAMGAYTGASAMTKGISSNAVTGALLGAGSSLFTGQSLIGSTFAGATIGGSGRKQLAGFGAAFKAIRSKQIQRHGKDSGPNLAAAKFATRATYSAIKKDIGQTWRGRSTRTSKNSGKINSNKSK
jgi:hypothetical protein